MLYQKKEKTEAANSQFECKQKTKPEIIFHSLQYFTCLPKDHPSYSETYVLQLITDATNIKNN